MSESSRDPSPPDALERALRDIAARPDDLAPLHALGLALAALGRWGEAAGAYELAAGRARGEWAAARWEEAAECHLRERDHAAWLAAVERALGACAPTARRLTWAASAFDALGQRAEAHRLYQRALRLDPRDPQLLMALAAHYEAAGERARAIQAYSGVAAVAPQHPEASRRLSGLLDQRVPTWHFPMMNDAPRNAAFRAAIEARVTPEARVLDIGCGAGLLSLLAARAGAAAVYACESEPEVARVAREVVARNGYDEQIRVVHKRSTQMRVGEDLPDRLDLLVCEIFDVSLLGEDALHTIADAKARLLREGAQVIPAGARVWCQPVESDELRARFHVERAEGFDLSPFNRLRDPRVLQLDLRRFSYTPLSEPVLAAEFNFEGDFALWGDEVHAAEVTRGGRVDGFIFWYDLLLDPAGDITLSTSPHQDGTHWMQGFAPRYDAQPTVAPGEALTFMCSYRRFLLWFSCL